MAKKVRDAQLTKIPYTLVVGDKEIEAGTVAVRDRGGTEVRGIPFEAFLARAVEEHRSKAVETGDVEGLA